MSVREMERLRVVARECRRGGGGERVRVRGWWQESDNKGERLRETESSESEGKSVRVQGFSLF